MGKGAARTTSRAVPVDPPVGDELVGPSQAQPVPIVIPGLQEALAHILTTCTSLAQAVSIPDAATTSQDEQRRLERFGRLQPPSFSGGEGGDAQGFLDRCLRILRTACILETSGVSFTAFQFSGVAFIWWEAYERHKTVGATPFTWQQFSILFLEKFMPQSRRNELRKQFEQLCQGDMSVT
ncbi:uncharacterized protein [Nicotiana tomentosiformis]|uniref:uncharacterized protein n=1 Tax=Nicotiana tomentosiformis TaxID=4098 RepID=UPI00388C5F21